MKARTIFLSASIFVVVFLSLGLPFRQATAGNRLADVEARGTVNCGIWPYVPGFAVARNGQYVGFDVDFCRALAAAIFGDATKVRFITLANMKQFAERKEVDLAVRRLTWTLRREASDHVAFGPVIFYDGQGFLIAKRSDVKRASQLAGARICVMGGDNHSETLYEYFRSMGRNIELVVVGSDHEAEELLRLNRCVAYSADISWLAAARSTFHDGPARFKILTDEIDKEPLAPMVREGDVELLQLLRWTIYAMIEAEELGLTSRNIDSGTLVSSPIRSFLAVHPDSRVALGGGEWVRAIISQVGNYGEVFDHNLGADSPIKLDRGLNRLWVDGGLVYAPPLGR